ncbi:uncharacterized protein SCHCODRAFT_02702255 [Schizophyllum commune H4-8]|nr:uncharacterized protein SCHCODRAFT_02702255 [Schizophyllum commune H4-8]KAI5891483.1 hypothetical protein SCHCODRAFT_02702255 [Schizophyllum commune H4-8]
MSLLPSISTFITRSRNPAHVLDYLTRTVPQHLGSSNHEQSRNRPAILLVLGISPDNTDLAREHGAVLNDLVSEVQGWTARANVVGCITAPPPIARPRSVHLGNEGDSLLSCALAVFPSASARAFRVEYDDDGRVRVGRWHAFGDKQKEDPGEVIEGLRLEDLANKHLITLSASLTVPHAITRSRSLLNLHTSATPFLTGLPHTLFYNKRILERGCVGVALDTWPQAEVKPTFSGMRRVDEKTYSVTEAQGNLITGLSGEKPTHHFLRTARKAGAEPAMSLVEDQGFALGVVRDGTVTQMHTIMSSDPSRGTLALEEGAYIPSGKDVAFFVRDPSVSNADRDLLRRPSQPNIAFVNPPYMTSVEVEPSHAEDRAGLNAVFPDSAEEIVLPDTFLASSEEGFSMMEGLGMVCGLWWPDLNLKRLGVVYFTFAFSVHRVFFHEYVA